MLYRDLKLENILIDALGRIKITDFGLSKPNCNEGEITYSYCGSPEYMAPEMLLKSVWGYLGAGIPMRSITILLGFCYMSYC